ncbi:DUF305 domain-containing protein [Streptomyces sp. BI20]|uniref:DUF305 domain-containing protein n=1 Tax=Streptomyces sp. BI20 TaxID=3403460 RepID=UPI003C78EC4F
MRVYVAALAAVAVAAVFATGATVVAAGRGDSAPGPAAAEARGGPGTPATSPDPASPDAGFARDMSVHHQQAVEMSFVVRDRTGDEDVRRLAYDIANTQANQRGMMLGWLDLWGLPKVAPALPPMSWMHEGGSGGEDAAGTAGMPGMPGMDHGGAVTKPGALMPGMATKEEIARLGTLSGREAEVFWLRLMTEHHKGGVAMAEGCARLCEVPTQRKLAQGMVDAQRSEIALMADMLRARGATP